VPHGARNERLLESSEEILDAAAQHVNIHLNIFKDRVNLKY
jgi:hypothetical protein